MNMSYNSTSYQQMNADCCCFNLRKATRAVTQLYDRIFESAGIRSTQYTLLLMLTASQGKTLTEMAEELGMDRTTLTRNLRPLSKKLALIEEVNLSDRRSKGYRLTDKGKQMVDNLARLWKSAQDQIIDKFGNERYKKLLTELETIRSYANLPKQTRVKQRNNVRGG